MGCLGLDRRPGGPPVIPDIKFDDCVLLLLIYSAGKCLFFENSDNTACQKPGTRFYIIIMD